MLEAINKAVAEIEGFIVDVELKKGNAKITSVYVWLSHAAAQIVGARTVGQQMAFAHTAMKEIPEFTRELREYMLLLPTLGVPGNVQNDYAARLKAIHLLALAASALFTLDKMYMQFTAFAAANPAHDNDDKVGHADHVSETWRTLKLDVTLGGPRSVRRANWDSRKTASCWPWTAEVSAMMRERAAAITMSFNWGFAGKRSPPRCDLWRGLCRAVVRRRPLAARTRTSLACPPISRGC